MQLSACQEILDLVDKLLSSKNYSKRETLDKFNIIKDYLLTQMNDLRDDIKKEEKENY